LKPEANMTIRLGPKGGVVRGYVCAKGKSKECDVETGFPATVTICRADDAHACIDVTGRHFRTLVPPNTDLTLKVVAAGFKMWTYAGAKGVPLRLHSAEELDLTIAMERLTGGVTGGK
jgi:hypothetical protein